MGGLNHFVSQSFDTITSTIIISNYLLVFFIYFIFSSYFIIFLKESCGPKPLDILRHVHLEVEVDLEVELRVEVKVK